MSDAVPAELDEQQLVAAHFRAACARYETAYEALTDLINELLPHAEALDDPENFVENFKLSRKFSARTMRQIIEVLERHAADESHPSAMFQEMLTQFSEVDGIHELVTTLHRIMSRPPRTPILLNGLLTSAVGAFESHLAAVTSAFFRASPQALEAVPREREKEFSLADLKSLDSVSDAIDLAISRRVDDLLFGGLEDWAKFYRDRLNIDFAELALDWTKLQEALERRHVFVHNAGMATRRYVDRIDSNVSVGDSLSFDATYLRRALDELFVLGYLLSIATWRKFCKTPTSRVGPSNSVQTLGYVMLRRRSYGVASAICAYGLKYPIDDSDRWLHQINFWIAKKAECGLDHVRADIEAWDASALEKKFRLAKLCLLEKSAEAIGLLHQLHESGDVTSNDIVEWPLFHDLRSDEQFAALEAEARADISASSSMELFLKNPRSQFFHDENCGRVGDEATSVDAQVIREHGLRPCGSCCPEVNDTELSA